MFLDGYLGIAEQFLIIMMSHMFVILIDTEVRMLCRLL
jgi:hypothetical protein